MAELSASLARTPELDRWISIGADGSVTIRSGKVEIGQGILTALSLIVAEELDVEPSRVSIETAATGVTPNEMITAGSMSIEHSGAALRQAAATARHLMLTAAALELGVARDVLEVDDGVISGPGLNVATSYWNLQGGKPFGVTIEAPSAEKDPGSYRYVGRGRQPRIDIRAKVRGAPVFVHDLEFPDMLHARLVRPPSYHHRLVSLADIDLPEGVSLLRDGSFLAVAAGDEYQAVRAARRIEAAAHWRQTKTIARVEPLAEYMKDHETATLPLRDGVPTATAVSHLAATAGRHRASYSRPFIMHGSIGPSAAVALWSETNELTVWSPSQGIEPLRATLAQALVIDVEQVRVVYAQGAGCYGHNGADDVSLDAALCARAWPGRHVAVKWTRAQEHQWEPYGPAMYVEMAADLDTDGRIRQWTHDVWSFPHAGRPFPGRAGIDLIGAWHIERGADRTPPSPTLAPEAGIHRNALPIYAFPRQEVVKRFVAASPLRTSSLRSLGAQANVFAIESFMDELAERAGADPVEFRLTHLQDERARAVLEAAVDSAGGLAPGRGVGLARYKNKQCYAAVVAAVDVDLQTAIVRVNDLWIAADAGQIVDRDGLINQLEGGAVQALSWALKEAVRFDASGISSVDWASYPILRFDEVPEVQTTLIDRPELPSMGAGEATQGPTSAALGNALYSACGLRVRDLPMTPDRLREVAAE